MKHNSVDLILRVLEIIEYPGNRVKFVKRFSVLCHYKACWSLVDRLSDKDQEWIKKKLDKNITPISLKIHLMKWYVEDDYKQALRQASKKLFTNSFTRVVSRLGEGKKEELRVLLGSE